MDFSSQSSGWTLVCVGTLVCFTTLSQQEPADFYTSMGYATRGSWPYY